MLRRVGAACLFLFIGGCGYLFGDSGYFRDSSSDYRKARATEMIELPEGRPAGFQEMYPIPPIQSDALMSRQFEVPRPTSLASGRAEEMVRIQRLGDESWALVSIAPGQLWPQVRGFLSAAGISPGRIDAGQGTIDTDWLKLRDQTMESRFRFRVERGVQRGTSELHVLQMNRAGDTSGWPAVSDNKEHEAEMLRSVAQYVANSSETAPVSMMADRAISAGGKIGVEEDESGSAFIRLGLPFNRAWASLALALEAARFEIRDRDRSTGNYYVRFVGEEEEEKKGWFRRLFGSKSNHPLADRQFTVTVIEADTDEVRIDLEPGEGEAMLESGQKQALLESIKGNIN